MVRDESEEKYVMTCDLCQATFGFTGTCDDDLTRLSQLLGWTHEKRGDQILLDVCPRCSRPKSPYEETIHLEAEQIYSALQKLPPGIYKSDDGRISVVIGNCKKAKPTDLEDALNRR